MIPFIASTNFAWCGQGHGARKAATLNGAGGTHPRTMEQPRQAKIERIHS